jgi:uncharacterized Zn ribbon protein
MSMGFKKCPYCNNCEAEALYAVDGKVEWFCINCLAEWTEEPVGEVTTAQQGWMMRNYGEE